MVKKKNRLVKENNFEPAPGGMGSLTYAPGWGTHASPEVHQDPTKFATGGSLHKSPSKDTMADSGSAQLSRDVDQMFSNDDVPSVDDVVAGMNYELRIMVIKDKKMAKQRVVANLKKNPHYYSDLDQLNINMDKTPEEIKKDNQISEINKIFEDMAKEKVNRFEVKPELSEIMKSMWADKQKRRHWTE